MERIPISKKIRFEVFKRDQFTCQYCGRMAPDVILEVDHIDPVAEGGTNDIMNLITSCRDCNRGKGKNKLSDKKIISLQQQSLKELAEKREQLEMVAEWKKELLNYNTQAINMLSDYFEQLTGSSVNEHGRNNINVWLKRFGVEKIMTAMENSVKTYCKEFSYEEIEKAFKKIPGVCINCEKGNSSQIYYFNYIKKVLNSKNIKFDLKLLKYYVDTYLVSDDAFEEEKKTKRYIKMFENRKFDISIKKVQDRIMQNCYIPMGDIDCKKTIENLKYGLNTNHKGYFFSDRYSLQNRIDLKPYVKNFIEFIEEFYKEYYNTFNEPHPELTIEQCLKLLNRYARNAYWGLATKETYRNMSFVLSIGKEMNSKVRIMEAMSACGTGICREKYEEYESEKGTHKFEC